MGDGPRTLAEISRDDDPVVARGASSWRTCSGGAPARAVRMPASNELGTGEEALANVAIFLEMEFGMGVLTGVGDQTS